MKKFQLLVVVLISALLVDAGVVERTYYFDNPTVVNKDEFQMIYLDQTQLFGITGEPALPYHSVQLLLPPGDKAVSMEFIGDEEVIIPGFFNLYPQQASRPLSQPGNIVFTMNDNVYQTDAAYPSKPTGELITSYLNGYAFALSCFTPVRYNPVTGVVMLYKKVTLKIHTESSNQSAIALENLKHSIAIVNKIGGFAQNPEMMMQYPAGAKPVGDYQLLIITPSQFSGNFQDLTETYLRRGIKSEIVTKESINSTGVGQDLQEKIRNFIIQEYQDNNVEFVMLGGDVEHIPYRGFYCYVVSGGGYEDSNIPADLYYSGLDGTWNTDNDGYWGEPGEDDLLPDIAVGRFSFSNLTELNAMLHKTIYYQDYPVLGEFTRTTLAGEWLYSDPETWGSDYLELLIGHHTENGYETWGIPEEYTYFKLYEENQSWGASDLMAQINAGRQYIHHVGHANSNYVAYMSNSDITNANFSGANGTTHNYTIFHSHGCICGAFDDSDCIMEKMASIDNFAVAAVGNSRYGWFNEGQTEGPAAHLHREMMDAVYHEKLNHIGAAFVEAKIQTAPWVTAPGQWEEGALRWNFYDINILGDPALSLWTAEPITLSVTYPNTLVVGAVSADVSVSSGGLPMENFRCALLANGELLGVGVTDASGNAVISFDPLPAPGDAMLVVSGYNCLPTEYPVTIIPGTTAYVIYSAHAIDDSQGNGNGYIDFGEAISFDLTLENISSLQADNVVATLNTSDPFITITDGSAGFGNIAPGGTPTVTGAFSFTVADNIPDQHAVTFDLVISWSGDSGSSTLTETVNAPAFTIGAITIDDTGSGNGDGVLDPGETADIVIPVSNEGHAVSPDAVGNLSTTSTDITITSGTVSLGVFDAGETKNAVFTISAAALAQPGTAFDLGFDLVSGNYTAQNTFYLTIGLVVEDFETGNFSAFGWQFGGNADWTVCNVAPYEGSYCARSGAVGDQESSIITLDMQVAAADDISFYLKVSSESSYDYLRFYIDDILKGEWSGEMAWQEASFPVSAGMHTFKWSYEKDYSLAGGSDCAWIDYIVFPASEASTGLAQQSDKTFLLYPNPNTGSFNVAAGYTGELRITVRNTAEVKVFDAIRTVDGQIMITLDHPAAGIYFITLAGEDFVKTGKIVIR
jgi:hypothetical protein